MRHALLPLAAVMIGLLAGRAEGRADAGPILERVAAAYAEAGPMRMAARVEGIYDVAGREIRETAAYEALWGGEGRFRYEIDGELLAAGDGEHTFVYLPLVHRYIRGEWPAGEGGSGVGELEPTLLTLLIDHNVGLLLAMADDPRAALAVLGRVEAAPAEEGRPAVRIDRGAQPTLTLVFDPETHLLAEARVDEAATLVAAGVPEVRQAVKITRYERVEPRADLDAAELAWDPPPTARRIDPGEATAGMTGEAMVGQPAPALDLPLLGGGRFSLAGTREQVVVLDFWATWCGPCVQGMPHLDALAKARAAEGLTVVAINLRESPQDIAAFMEARGLALTVALDADGTAAQAWGVRGIPHTVVIGRDGVVREVVVGLNPQAVDAAVEAALEQPRR